MEHRPSSCRRARRALREMRADITIGVTERRATR